MQIGRNNFSTFLWPSLSTNFPFYSSSSYSSWVYMIITLQFLCSWSNQMSLLYYGEFLQYDKIILKDIACLHALDLTLFAFYLFGVPYFSTILRIILYFYILRLFYAIKKIQSSFPVEPFGATKIKVKEY